MAQMILSVAALLFLHSIEANPLPPSPAHAFDLGLLDSCVQPTVQQLSNCHQFVDYPVPSVLLSDKLLNIKQKRISSVWSTARNYELAAGTGNVSLADACARSALEHKCKEEFPPCYTMQGNTTHKMVGFSPPDPCLSASIATNPCTYYQPSCSTTSANVSLTTCHLTTHLTDYNYTYCSLLSDWSSTYITKWMHVFLQNVEQDVVEFAEALNSDAAREVCVPLYVELQCGTVGRCSHQGTRAEMNATREVCDALMNCVGSNLRTSLSSYINCSQYPSVTNKLPTSATPITQPTTPPPPPPTVIINDTNTTLTEKPTERPSQATGTTQQPTVLFPDVPDRISSSGCQLSYQRLVLLLCVIVLCVVALLL